MKISRSRQLTAVLALAAILCINQVAAPASHAGPQVVDLVRRIAGRFATSLQRTVPTSRLQVSHREPGHTAAVAKQFYAPNEPIAPQPTHPFQFRLPPPVC